jgi:fermentation-respiration switch protein FrsA (DUF1100 family)
MKRLLLWALGIGVAIYALIAAALFVFQRDLLYVPDTSRPDRAQTGVAAVRDVEITTADGLRLLAWYLPPADGRPVIVYFHGNGGHLGYRDGRMTHFHADGFGALFPEYRGYGGNPGRPSEDGLYTDARAALDFVAAQGIDPARVVLFGESLGSGVAVRLASERQVGAVVLETPYSSIVDVAQDHFPFIPVRWLLTDRFDALSKIGAIHAPILVMLGGEDVIVPMRFGRRLFEAANAPKQLWIAPEGGHGDLPEFGSLDVVSTFIHKHLPASWSPK